MTDEPTIPAAQPPEPDRSPPEPAQSEVTEPEPLHLPKPMTPTEGLLEATP